MGKISYKLEHFEGPLDLILHLISKNKLDINHVKITDILDQYVCHIDKMKELNMDISSEFLEMAARLVYIKTVSLLPKSEEVELLEKQLTGQLIEYQECKLVAQTLRQMLDLGSFVRDNELIEFDMSYQNRHGVDELINAYLQIKIQDAKNNLPTQESFSDLVSREVVSVTAKIVYVLRKLWDGQEIEYMDLFKDSKNKSEMVALFLAVLELTRANRIKINDSQVVTKLKLVKGG